MMKSIVSNFLSPAQPRKPQTGQTTREFVQSRDDVRTRRLPEKRNVAESLSDDDLIRDQTDCISRTDKHEGNGVVAVKRRNSTTTEVLRLKNIISELKNQAETQVALHDKHIGEIIALKNKLHHQEARLQRDYQVWQHNFAGECREALDAEISQVKGELHGGFNRQYNQLHAEAEAAITGKELEHQRVVDMANANAQELARTKDSRINELERHVVDLKQSISTLGRTQSQVADDILREQTRNLAHEVLNWVAKSCRGHKLVSNSFELSENTEKLLHDALPMYWQMESSSKLSIFQAIIAKQLMRLFQTRFYTGIPADGPLGQVVAVADYFYDAKSPDFYQWRYLTVNILDKLKDERVAATTSNLAENIGDQVEQALQELLGVTPSATREQGIRSILRNAIDLAHLFQVQRAVFEFELPTANPHKSVLFDNDTMEDEFGQETPEMGGKYISFATFPAVVKYGDERGDNMELKNVISKARVHCADK